MTSAEGVARDLVALPAKIAGAAHTVVVTHGALLQAAVRRRASAPRTSTRPKFGGTEGPRALTGDYRRRISRRTVRRPSGSTVYVGTNDVRGAALEFGNPEAFGGTRETQPYPHYGPALDEISGPFETAVSNAAGAAIKADRK